MVTMITYFPQNVDLHVDCTSRAVSDWAETSAPWLQPENKPVVLWPSTLVLSRLHHSFTS